MPQLVRDRTSDSNDHSSRRLPSTLFLTSSSSRGQSGERKMITKNTTHGEAHVQSERHVPEVQADFSCAETRSGARSGRHTVGRGRSSSSNRGSGGGVNILLPSGPPVVEAEHHNIGRDDQGAEQSLSTPAQGGLVASVSGGALFLTTSGLSSTVNTLRPWDDASRAVQSSENERPEREISGPREKSRASPLVSGAAQRSNLASCCGPAEGGGAGDALLTSEGAPWNRMRMLGLGDSLSGTSHSLLISSAPAAAQAQVLVNSDLDFSTRSFSNTLQALLPTSPFGQLNTQLSGLVPSYNPTGAGDAAATVSVVRTDKSDDGLPEDSAGGRKRRSSTRSLRPARVSVASTTKSSGRRQSHRHSLTRGHSSSHLVVPIPTGSSYENSGAVAGGGLDWSTAGPGNLQNSGKDLLHVPPSRNSGQQQSGKTGRRRSSGNQGQTSRLAQELLSLANPGRRLLGAPAADSGLMNSAPGHGLATRDHGHSHVYGLHPSQNGKAETVPQGRGHHRGHSAETGLNDIVGATVHRKGLHAHRSGRSKHDPEAAEEENTKLPVPRKRLSASNRPGSW
ncbi:unnamed protein product [Amoebophrya sp. A25]|nr:unnamed protein product [Amoebophrya sp. A25]|eukprot:GSA25T00000088001.1